MCNCYYILASCRPTSPVPIHLYTVYGLWEKFLDSLKNSPQATHPMSGNVNKSSSIGAVYVKENFIVYYSKWCAVGYNIRSWQRLKKKKKKRCKSSTHLHRHPQET